MTLAVIIPCYNNEKYLPKCLDSVLSQTRLPDEIIVVDDRSTDNSAEIIKEYEKKSDLIKGIFLAENGGVSHARNTGILAAKSEYITTLDSDDFYYNCEKLDNEMKLIEKYSGKAVAYSKLVYCDDEDNIIRYVDYKKSEYFEGDIHKALLCEKIRRTLMRDYCFPKQAIVDAGMYDESMSLFEDYDVLIRLAKRLPFYCTFEYGTAYRQKETGLSHRSDEEIKAGKTYATEKNLEDINPLERAALRFYRNGCNKIIKLYKKLK